MLLGRLPEVSQERPQETQLRACAHSLGVAHYESAPPLTRPEHKSMEGSGLTGVLPAFDVPNMCE